MIQYMTVRFVGVSQIKDKEWFQILHILYSLPDHIKNHLGFFFVVGFFFPLKLMHFTSLQPCIDTPGKHDVLKLNYLLYRLKHVKKH